MIYDYVWLFMCMIIVNICIYSFKCGIRLFTTEYRRKFSDCIICNPPILQPLQHTTSSPILPPCIIWFWLMYILANKPLIFPVPTHYVWIVSNLLAYINILFSNCYFNTSKACLLFFKQEKNLYFFIYIIKKNSFVDRFIYIDLFK